MKSKIRYNDLFQNSGTSDKLLQFWNDWRARETRSALQRCNARITEINEAYHLGTADNPSAVHLANAQTVRRQAAK